MKSVLSNLFNTTLNFQVKLDKIHNEICISCNFLEVHVDLTRYLKYFYQIIKYFLQLSSLHLQNVYIFYILVTTYTHEHTHTNDGIMSF